MEIKGQFKKLRLHGMSESWQVLTETKKLSELTLSEGIELLLESETQDRDNKRFQRLHKNAHFRYQSSIEELHMDAARGMNRSLIDILAKGDYVRNGESVLITGATGCGKSFLASAMGHKACTQGYKVAYYNVQKLLLKTKMCRADGTIIKFMNSIAKTELLILDDYGLIHLDQQQRMDLLEIIEDRHGIASTIIASQLPVENWYEIIGEQTIADAILDRLIHSSHRVQLKGNSLRGKKR
jgi:DNA replication protein DnaC